MSTPFPLEAQAQTERFEPSWDPWKGPAAPHTWQGMGFTQDTAYLGPMYRALEAAGSGAAKGIAVLNGAWHGLWAPLADIAEEQGAPGASLLRALEQRTAANEQDARERVKAMTPDPSTTGAAVQLLHGVGEGAYLMSVGSLLGPLGAAGVVGVAQGGSRYQDLREQGVGTGTATTASAFTGVTSAAGALLPAAYGSTLATRMLTGAVSNAALGMVNRYADHKILELGGYPEMAAQQKAWDSTQMLVDAALGATFGAIHHFRSQAEVRAAAALRSPDTQDAALAANLALRDRAAAPGVPVDPESAAAHQAALEKASSDLLQGKPVDVSGTGVDQASFLSRPLSENLTAAKVILDSFKESGLLEEEANLRDLEEQFAQRTGQSITQPSSATVGSALETTTKQPAAKVEPGAPKEFADPVAQALAERPGLQIPDEGGEPIDATQALSQVDAAAKQSASELPTAIAAAINCFSRKGG